MAAENTLTTLNGLTKAKYADSVINVVPDFAKVLKRTKYSKKDRIGASYNQPVILSNEQGITFGNSSSTLPLSLNAAVAMTMQNATLSSMFFALRGQIGVDAIIRTQSKDQAVEDALDLLVTNMVESESGYIESELLYGSAGIGATGTGAFTSVDGTTETIPLPDMAPGMFAGKEGAKLSIYNSTSAVGTGAFTISRVDTATPALTVTAAGADITALHALTGTNLTLYWYGAYGVEFPGIEAVAGNTGTLYGVSGALVGGYSLWRGNTFSSGSGALTFGKLQEAVAVAVGKGLSEDADVLVSPQTWSNLLNDQAGLRRYTGSENVMKNGAEELEYTSSNGKLTIIPHGYIKPNKAFIVPSLSKRWKRIGSVELAFNPGVEDPDKYFVMLASSLGYETRLVSDTSLFLETAPARCVLINNITNTTN